MIAARILFVRVTRSLLEDEVEGGLERMAMTPLAPKVEYSLQRSSCESPLPAMF